MTPLSKEFSDSTRLLMGEERFGRYMQSFGEQAPVSIRLNPLKSGGLAAVGGEPVPWCRHGYYLPSRPQFTMDPLLHAGCYYVQEAASMFLDYVVSEMLSASPTPPRNSAAAGGDVAAGLSQPLDLGTSPAVLDLCAAPGGKSTLLRAALPADCVLYSNEPVRQRAAVLAENVAKWGAPNHRVTSLYARDYRAAKALFDVILCDVPCSGEGMFRKDPATIGEWSPRHVDHCWRLQRDIVSDIWPCLSDGGLLIYSTCTFNTKENEENVRWIVDTYDAEVVGVDAKPEWNITGSLLAGFDAPVYRFIPGITRGEGLFMAVVRKKGGQPRTARRKPAGVACLELPTTPAAASVTGPRVPLSYTQAMAFLRGEALRLPDDTPRGEVTVTFQGHPLGTVKNIGSRANNLYPKAWRIKTTHIPDEYEPILKHV